LRRKGNRRSRRPEEADFLGQLMEGQEKNPNYTFVGTMTERAKIKPEVGW
jgi:hypothetical protein